MMSKQTAAAMIVALTSGTLALPHAASGQLPGVSPAVLGTAHNYTALARGFTAIALNPAGLGMPGNPGFSLTLFPVQARAGLSAMKLSEIAAFDDQKISDATKRQWLQAAVDDEGFELSSGVSATGFALSAGPIGLQISSVGEARANISPDAFELLLFGNAGLTGTTRDMSLAGTRVDSWAATTGALALGIPLPGVSDGSFALGATLKYTVGHIVGSALDAGSVVRSNPFSVDLALPSIVPNFNNLSANNGSGVGMDLGLAWEGTAWAVSAAVQNVFNTFQWDLAGFEYRVGTITLDGGSPTTDFDALSATGTTSVLLTELLAQRFELAVNMGVAFRPSDKLALSADFRHDTGEALVIGARSRIGIGAEFRVIPFLPLRGGISRISGGAIQLGLGLGLELGPVVISGAYLSQKGSAGELRAASLALSFGQ